VDSSPLGAYQNRGSEALLVNRTRHKPRLLPKLLPFDRGTRAGTGWAVDEATRRRLPVHLLCAWQSDYAAETLAPLVPSIEEDCQALLDRAAAQARAVSPRLDIHGSTVHAQPASALIAASRDADTVVVGSRGLGSVKEALAGSTSMQVASHASCPVAVVREAVARRDADRRIMVGVDGSALSTEATGYAFKQASQRGLGVTVLHSWDADQYTSGVAMSVLEDTWNDLELDRQAVTSQAIAE
jgi:nucleotide-binding universal stress UspA family protein